MCLWVTGTKCVGDSFAAIFLAEVFFVWSLFLSKQKEGMWIDFWAYWCGKNNLKVKIREFSNEIMLNWTPQKHFKWLSSRHHNRFVIPDDGWSLHGWFNMVQFSFGDFLGWWVMEPEEARKTSSYFAKLSQNPVKNEDFWREFDSWNTCIWLIWGIQICMTNLKDLLVKSVDG